jgi:hypothetical protein
MTGTRVRCAAADFWGDKHLCIGSWYVVTDSEGRQFDLCSGACLVEYATLGALSAVSPLSESESRLLSIAKVLDALPHASRLAGNGKVADSPPRGGSGPVEAA